MSERSPCRVSNVLCVGLFAVALGACGDQNLFESLADDDTTVAEVESAKIAIDNQNFTQAIAILQGLCGTSTTAPTCDADTASLFASAYAGRAGLNVFDLIKEAAGVVSGTTLDSLSAFSTQLSSPTADDKSDLRDAVEVLVSISGPTANQNLQMAIAAMAAIVVTVGVDLTDGFNNATGRPTVFPDQPTIQNAEDTRRTLTQVANDLVLVSDGLDGSGLGNENLRREIEDLKDAIDKDGNGAVEADEMYLFLLDLRQ